MPFSFNLLLLPLLGGFIFTRYWNKTRYEALRAENQRLLLLSSVWGLAFLVTAFVITSLLRAKYPGLAIWWNTHIQIPHSGTSCVAFLLGAFAWIPLNLFFFRDRVVSKLIEENGDRFELLLKKAMEEEKTVSVTLKNGKVYAGLVQAALNPANRITSVGIIPVRSGYRDDETKSLIFTNDYKAIFRELVKEYDDIEAELIVKRRELKSRSRQLVTKGEEMSRASEEARTDVIIDPKASAVQGELNSIDADVKELQEQITAMASRLDIIADGIEDYETIIPIDEICILSIYNDDFYKRYFEAQRADTGEQRNS
jgi:hypothetical protein